MIFSHPDLSFIQYILITILKDGKEKLHVQLTGARRLYTCPTFDASSFTDLSWFTRACSRLQTPPTYCRTRPKDGPLRKVLFSFSVHGLARSLHGRVVIVVFANMFNFWENSVYVEPTCSVFQSSLLLGKQLLPWGSSLKSFNYFRYSFEDKRLNLSPAWLHIWPSVRSNQLKHRAFWCRTKLYSLHKGGFQTGS